MNIYDLFAFLLSIFFVFFESVILKFINSSTVLPDIMLLILVYYSIKTNSIKAQLFGFAIGMIKDFLSSSPLGYYGIIYLTIGYLSSKFRGRSISDNYLFLVFVSFLMFIVKSIFIILYFALVKNIGFVTQFVSSKFLLEVGLSEALSSVIFLLMGYIFSKTSSKTNEKYDGV